MIKDCWCSCTRLREAEEKAAKWDDVVRCGDCKFVGIGMTGMQCDRYVFAIEHGESVPAAKVVTPDHFCSWGELR